MKTDKMLYYHFMHFIPNKIYQFLLVFKLYVICFYNCFKAIIEEALAIILI